MVQEMALQKLRALLLAQTLAAKGAGYRPYFGDYMSSDRQRAVGADKLSATTPNYRRQNLNSPTLFAESNLAAA